jgi:hypothetical protein
VQLLTASLSCLYCLCNVSPLKAAIAIIIFRSAHVRSKDVSSNAVQEIDTMSEFTSKAVDAATIRSLALESKSHSFSLYATGACSLLLRISFNCSILDNFNSSKLGPCTFLIIY